MGSAASSLYAQREYSEKRNFYRMRVDADIEVTIENSNECISAHCLNLSGTGMLFKSQEQFESGIVCRTRIAAGSPITADLDARIEVIRCISNGPDSYLIGAEIIDFNP